MTILMTSQVKKLAPNTQTKIVAAPISWPLKEAFSPAFTSWARIFGFIALGIGLSLIALIVYAMLFGYR